MLNNEAYSVLMFTLGYERQGSELNQKILLKITKSIRLLPSSFNNTNKSTST